MNLNEFLNQWREATYKTIEDDVVFVRAHIERALELVLECSASQAETRHGVNSL